MLDTFQKSLEKNDINFPEPLINDTQEDTVETFLKTYGDTKVMLSNGACMTFRDFHDAYSTLLYYCTDRSVFREIYKLLTHLTDIIKPDERFLAPKTTEQALALLEHIKYKSKKSFNEIEHAPLMRIGFLDHNKECPIHLRHVLATSFVTTIENGKNVTRIKPAIVQKSGELPALWSHNEFYKIAKMEEVWEKINGIYQNETDRSLLMEFLSKASRDGALPQSTLHDHCVRLALSKADLLITDQTSIVLDASLIAKHCIISNKLLSLREIDEQSLLQMLK